MEVHHVGMTQAMQLRDVLLEQSLSPPADGLLARELHCYLHLVPYAAIDLHFTSANEQAAVCPQMQVAFADDDGICR